MHDIEPHYRWRDHYTAETDELSPFYGRRYSEFEFEHKLYNFYLHPQWDAFGSATLYGKILFADYEAAYVIIELIGEWNDVLYNDIMHLKRNVIEPLYDAGISKFVLLCDHVLNFHADADDDYYSEWAEEVRDYGGWIALLNTRQHVEEELDDARLQHYLYFGPGMHLSNWRSQKPAWVFQMVEHAVLHGQKMIG